MQDSTFVKRLYSELPRLVERGVIDETSAGRIREHYGEPAGSGRLIFLAFGSIGALLIGGGIILLIAHNWDTFSRPTRVAISFAPLLICQGLALFVASRREASPAWREGAGIGWNLSVAAAIALVSQTYNLGGTIKDFLFAWVLLSLPVLYLLKSTAAAALSILALFFWRLSSPSFGSGAENPLYWPLLALTIPHAMAVFREDGGGHAALLGWLYCAALAGGMISANYTGIMVPFLYGCASGTLYLLGRRIEGETSSLFRRPFTAIGALGLMVLVFTFSFHEVWREISHPHNISRLYSRSSPLWEIWGLIGFWGLAWGLAAASAFVRGDKKGLIPGALPLVLGLAIIAESASEMVSAGLINLYGLAAGVTLILIGSRTGRLGTANAGMLLVLGLAFMRFLDSSQSILARGIAFIVLGTLFLTANLWLARRLKGEPA